MHRDDLLTNTLRWVFGYCLLWNQQVKQFDANSQEFTDFVHHTHHKVWRYLNGQQSLDASCSDLVCTAALEAQALFKPFINKEK